MNVGTRSFTRPLYPRAVLAYARMTADQTVTTLADVTGMVLRFNQVAGELYVYQFDLGGAKATTGTPTFHLTDEANGIVVSRSFSMNSGFAISFPVTFVELPTKDGWAVRKLRMQVDAGDYTIDPTPYPITFWVEGPLISA